MVICMGNGEICLVPLPILDIHAPWAILRSRQSPAVAQCGATTQTPGVFWALPV